MRLTRRSFLTTTAAMISSPLHAQEDVNEASTTEIESEVSRTVRHNISSFRALDWRPYFDNLKNGAILVDISSRADCFLKRLRNFLSPMA